MPTTAAHVLTVVLVALLLLAVLAAAGAVLASADLQPEDWPPYPGALTLPVLCAHQTFWVLNDPEVTYVRTLYYGIPANLVDPACTNRGICYTAGQIVSEQQAAGPWNLPLLQPFGPDFARRNIAVQFTNLAGHAPDVIMTPSGPCHRTTWLPLVPINP